MLPNTEITAVKDDLPESKNRKGNHRYRRDNHVKTALFIFKALGRKRNVRLCDRGIGICGIRDSKQAVRGWTLEGTFAGNWGSASSHHGHPSHSTGFAVYELQLEL